MDKDSINTDANEYSKSAGDNTSAATADAAFSADKTRPEQQHDTAAREAEEQGVSSSSSVSMALFLSLSTLCLTCVGTLGD